MSERSWRGEFTHDPIQPLLESGNRAVVYFTNRDLFDQKAEPIDVIWELPEVQKILRKQQADGSWRYPGKRAAVFPAHHYELLETWKQFRILVERYGLTKEHPLGARAAEFMFSCQTEAGDIRGMIGNQYATYYTGAMLAILIRAGYEDDPRVERGLRWLLDMRQEDGGWVVPIQTHTFDRKTQYRLTSEYAEPVEPDRGKPFSHNWTDMVLRAFAAYPKYRQLPEALHAAKLLKSRFFKPDVYTSYKAASYWVRFAFWWPNIITALESLAVMGFPKDDPDIKKGLDWLIGHHEPDGLWNITYVKGKEVHENAKNREERLWISLAICRVFSRFDYFR